MKKQQTKHKALINATYLVFFLFIISWITLWGNNSFYQKWRLRQKKSQTQAQYMTFKTQNDSLKQGNHKLKTDPDEQRRFLQARYGIYEEGETAYIFKQAQEDSLETPK